MDKSIIFKKILGFHQKALDKYNFPPRLSISFLENSLDKGGVFLPSSLDPKIFFILDKKSPFPNLKFPVIKNLTLLNKINAEIIKIFINYLKNKGKKFLFLVESYNKPALDLLSNLNSLETYYCQQKFICHLKNIEFKKFSYFKKIKIRNFDIKKDKLRYIQFYNKTLGFLGGFIDKKFIEEIILTHSFNPNGYFLAEAGNRIVGFLAVEKEPWGNAGSRFGYIFQIGVDNKYRGSGLAQLLLKKAVNFSLHGGVNRLGVGVRKNNFAAVKFFCNHGFLPIFETKGYFVDLDFLNKIMKARNII